jgi:hypothetical protein
LGGAALYPATFAQVVAAIAEGDARAAWCIAQSACAMMAAAYVEPRIAQEVFGDARAVFTFGFTNGQPPCLAVPVKDSWVIAGATAIFKGNPFERRFRDMRVVAQQVQGSVTRMQSAGNTTLG